MRGVIAVDFESLGGAAFRGGVYVRHNESYGSIIVRPDRTSLGMEREREEGETWEGGEKVMGAMTECV